MHHRFQLPKDVLLCGLLWSFAPLGQRGWTSIYKRPTRVSPIREYGIVVFSLK